MSGSLTGALKPLLAITLISALAACGGGTKFRPVSDNPVRVGPPYKVRGVTYTPTSQPNYDVLGYATWYGNESGNQVANGERFRPSWITAAHKTLPLPSYVEVTSLDTGRRIVVRVNDRGPYGESARVIDLSRGAAEALGVRGKGKAAVRVRVVEPPEKDRAALRKGKAAQELLPISPATLANLQSQFAKGVEPGVGTR